MVGLETPDMGMGDMGIDMDIDAVLDMDMGIDMNMDHFKNSNR